MPRSKIAALAALCLLVAAAPAAGRAFTVSKDGNKPSIAVDASGAAHVVWDSVSGDTSTTRYCRVPRAAAGCAAGSERTFVPVEGDQDFGGPRIFLTGGKGILIATARCCSSTEGPDGQFHSTRLFTFSSFDGGATFGPATWVGTQAPDIGAAYANGTVLTLGITGSGSGIQSSPVGGFSGTENTITPLLGTSGGVGVSPRGSIVGIGSQGNVLVGALAGDPNTSSVALRRVAKGSDVVVTSGPKGADLFYKTNARNQRYVVRRYAGGKAGRITPVSEAGFPIFGNAFQDGAGRVHAVWQGDLGLTYRRSGMTGRGFTRMKRLSRKSGFFNLVVAANGKGRAAMAFDSNGSSGRVGGFTAG